MGCVVVGVGVDVVLDVGVMWLLFEMWVWRGSGGGGADVVLDVGVFVFCFFLSMIVGCQCQRTNSSALTKLCTRAELHHPATKLQ